jgi:transposase InsO family protein
MTGAEIAECLGMALSTVSAVLSRIGLGKRSRLEPPEPPNRYQRARAGELIHVDVKKLGRIGHRGAGHRVSGNRGAGQRSRGAGWEFVHVCVDDHSRLGFADVMPDERKESAVTFLKAAVAWYARLGVTIERVMTDNGSCYRSKAFNKACSALSLRHIFTKPYTPRTNGKAERFIQSSLREWAYARAYANSDQRTDELQRWIHHYNWHRPHAGIKGKTPISRLGLDVNNVMRLHS